MNDTLRVQVVQSRSDLDQFLDDFFFGEGPPFFLSFFDKRVEIALLGILHDDAEGALRVYEELFQLYDVWMRQLFEQLSFLLGHANVFFLEGSKFDLLHGKQKFV